MQAHRESTARADAKHLSNKQFHMPGITTWDQEQIDVLDACTYSSYMDTYTTRDPRVEDKITFPIKSKTRVAHPPTPGCWEMVLWLVQYTEEKSLSLRNSFPFILGNLCSPWMPRSWSEGGYIPGAFDQKQTPTRKCDLRVKSWPFWSQRGALPLSSMGLDFTPCIYKQPKWLQDKAG